MDLRFYRVYPRNSRKKVELIPYEVIEDYDTELPSSLKATHERITYRKYDRINQVIDLEMMKNKHIIVLGCGG